MGLFSRLKTGFGMARRSGRVLRAHPNLLVFPLVGGIAGIAFLITLFGSLYASGLYEQSNAALYAVLFVAYVVETFVASFFSAALVSATRTAFRGEQPSVRRAMAAAWERKYPLLAWSVIAAVIGVVIRAIESQDNIVARILAGLFAVAWSVLTYFVIPVIVFRDPSVTEMLKESGKTFKDTYGESIGAMGAINIVTFLLMLGAAALGVLAFVALPGSVGLLGAILLGGSAMVFAALVGNALTGVAKTALYVYATEDRSPEFFDDMDLRSLGGDDAGPSGATGGPGGRSGGRI
jgi:MFS family permease